MTASRIGDYGHNSSSVAQEVAQKLNIRHIFCEPELDDRKRLGLKAGEEMVQYAMGLAAAKGRDFIEVHREEVRRQFPIREGFWADTLASLNPNAQAVLFVCGADHSLTALETFKRYNLDSTIACSDWTVLAEIPCPCCM